MPVTQSVAGSTQLHKRVGQRSEMRALACLSDWLLLVPLCLRPRCSEFRRPPPTTLSETCWHTLVMHFDQCLMKQLIRTHAERQSPHCFRFTMHRYVEHPIVTLQHAVPPAPLSASKSLLAHDHVGRDWHEAPDEHAQDRSGDDLRASRRQTCLLFELGGGLLYTLCRCRHVTLRAPHKRSCWYAQRLNSKIFCHACMQREHAVQSSLRPPCSCTLSARASL